MSERYKGIRWLEGLLFETVMLRIQAAQQRGPKHPAFARARATERKVSPIPDNAREQISSPGPTLQIHTPPTLNLYTLIPNFSQPTHFKKPFNLSKQNPTAGPLGKLRDRSPGFFNLTYQLQIPRLGFRAVAFVDDVEVCSNGEFISDGVYTIFADSLKDDLVVVIAVGFIHKHA